MVKTLQAAQPEITRPSSRPKSSGWPQAWQRSGDGTGIRRRSPPCRDRRRDGRRSPRPRQRRLVGPGDVFQHRALEEAGIVARLALERAMGNEIARDEERHLDVGARQIEHRRMAGLGKLQCRLGVGERVAVHLDADAADMGTDLDRGHSHLRISAAPTGRISSMLPTADAGDAASRAHRQRLASRGTAPSKGSRRRHRLGAEHFPTGRTLVDRTSPRIRKLAPILVARIVSIRAEYALGSGLN